MNRQICRTLIVVLSLAHGLWSQCTPEPPGQTPAAQSADQVRLRPVTWKQLVPNIGKDQAHIWTLPFRLAQGKHWPPVIAVTAITAGLVVADPYAGPYFRRTDTFHGFNSVLSTNT